MTAQTIVFIVLAALLVFWALGAHNRLMTLRSAIAAAWAQLDEPMQRRGHAVLSLTEALREPLADEGVALDSLHAAQQACAEAAQALRRRAQDAPRAKALAAAEAALAAALTRVLALLEPQAALRGEPVLASHLAVLHEAAPRMDFARQLYNDAVQAYNEALRQFPTQLLARLFGFAPAAGL